MATICVDGYNIALPHGTGIATYGRNLLKAANTSGFETHVLFGPKQKLSKNNIVNESLLVEVDRSKKNKISRKDKIFRSIETRIGLFGLDMTIIPRTNEVFWPRPIEATQFWAAQGLFDRANRGFQLYERFTPITFSGTFQPDVMHWTVPLPVFARNVPNIYTIHDLIPVQFPHTTLNDRNKFMRLHQQAVKKADHIAVVSEKTRQDVLRILGVSEKRVTNTYQTFHLPDSFNKEKLSVEIELDSMLSLGWKEYFLHFGAIEPKKNLGRIVEAYLSSGIKTPLVVVGGRGWLREDELALLEQYRRDSQLNDKKIRFYEYMSHDMLISLIRGAKATVFPSLYEGFGLPILESMALSTAVITSTAGALPEVAGDAAIIVDPLDVQALARALLAIDSDEALRRELENRGRIQASRFSPEAYQARLLDLYAKVGVSPATPKSKASTAPLA